MYSVDLYARVRRACFVDRMSKGEAARVFSELQSHYLFEDRFGCPGKGND